MTDSYLHPLAHPRERLNAKPEDVLKRLPEMGRLMINSKHLGATHERIGTVEKVTVEDGWIHFSSNEHASRIELAAISALVVDRTSVMQGKVYPRIDLQNSAADVIGSVIGFEGGEAFDSVLEQFGAGKALEVATPESKPATERKEIADDDQGLVPFKAAERNGATVRIELRLPSFVQHWQGAIPTVKPSMGFINVMQPDFHLHLKGESVASWTRENKDGHSHFHALNTEGEALGLIVSGPEDGFQ